MEVGLETSLIHREASSNQPWKKAEASCVPCAAHAICAVASPGHLPDCWELPGWAYFQLPALGGNSPGPGGFYCHDCFMYKNVSISTGAREHKCYTNSRWLHRRKDVALIKKVSMSNISTLGAGLKARTSSLISAARTSGWLQSACVWLDFESSTLCTNLEMILMHAC
jgi:hypothetical protein